MLTRILDGVGKRQRKTVYWEKEKRRLDRENKPFVPMLTVDIATGHVTEHRDIWQHGRGTGRDDS